MNRKNLTRNALFTSIISLLLCVSMLVGTTFAWFTDEVVSGMNTIAAGNLDVELLANGSQVNSNTKLFDGVEKWEPGVVVYENIQVANVGTLALKYQMTLNFRDKNDLNGHKLSEVVKVAVIDKVEGQTRAQVLEAAKANGTSLAEFHLTGSLLAGESSAEQAIVVYWAPNANEVDNLYNANNGQQTSDGEALSIEFGINLQATQKMSEEDSFGNDYDGPASFLPGAVVKDLGARKQMATVNGWGSSETPVEMSLPFVLQFQPRDTYEEALAGEYGLWHADYVVKADKAVSANSVALVGYYQAFCDAINEGRWVAMQSDEAIAANTDIRLVEQLGATVNYAEICNFGNDGTGFLCSATDLTGANAGTTITVELRLYKVPAKGECAIGGGCNHPGTECETGEYKVAGTYKYTFGAKAISSTADLQTAVNEGIGSIQLAAGEYKMPSTTTAGDITITGTKDTVIDVTKGAYMDNANVTIKGVTIKTSTGYVMDDAGNKGADYAALYSPDTTYINCTFVGPMRVGRDGAKFINCTFTELGNDYIWTYGNEVSFEGCTFNTDGKAILIYSDGNGDVPAVTVKNCTFNATQGAKAGAIVNQNCAAIEIHNYGCGVNLTASGNTCNSNFSGEWRIKTYENKPENTITVNGVVYTTIAIDGKIMTIDAEKNVTVQ